MVQIWQYLVNFSIFKMHFIDFNVMASICHCIDYKFVTTVEKALCDNLQDKISKLFEYTDNKVCTEEVLRRAKARLNFFPRNLCQVS